MAVVAPLYPLQLLGDVLVQEDRCIPWRLVIEHHPVASILGFAALHPSVVAAPAVQLLDHQICQLALAAHADVAPNPLKPCPPHVVADGSQGVACFRPAPRLSDGGVAAELPLLGLLGILHLPPVLQGALVLARAAIDLVLLLDSRLHVLIWRSPGVPVGVAVSIGVRAPQVAATLGLQLDMCSSSLCHHPRRTRPVES